MEFKADVIVAASQALESTLLLYPRGSLVMLESGNAFELFWARALQQCREHFVTKTADVPKP
jgi:hypothetical protein